MLFLIFMMFFTYLIASIPFGLLWARMMGCEDLRKYGSGNIGATNAVRVGGKKLGFLTLLSDALKGAMPVLFVKQYNYDYAIIIAFTAVFGHIFSIWLKFNGGKGVATSIAVIMSLNFTIGIIMCAVWLTTFLAVRISAIASLTAILSAIFIGVLLEIDYKTMVLCTILTVLVFYKHSNNIKQILSNNQ